MAKLILSNTGDKSGITRTFTSEDFDTTNDSSFQVEWQTAIIVSGTWLLYSETQFNDNHPDTGKMVVGNKDNFSTEVEVPLNFNPKSLRPLSHTPNTISVFEHKNYGGKMKQFSSAVNFLREFPTRNPAGVSSCFIKGRNWEFFTSVNYTGLRLGEVGSGYHPDLRNFFSGLVEPVASIRPV